jgi:hypothetical protein
LQGGDDAQEDLEKKLESAMRHIRANVGTFSPMDLEDMVNERLIDARSVPPELRTELVRYRLGLKK